LFQLFKLIINTYPEKFFYVSIAGFSGGRNTYYQEEHITGLFMEKLIIGPTSFTPRVILDHEEYFLEIAGESRPQDVREFYGPVLAWMNDFGDLVSSGKRQDPIIFNFNFDYFNSASAKCILDICKVLARLNANKFDVSVKWYYIKNDSDMFEAGVEMSQIVKIPFEFIEIEEQ